MPAIRAADARIDTNADTPDDPLGMFTARLYSDTGGLTQFGAFTETLAPGAFSAKLHWHEAEDEFVYVLAGTPTLIEGAQETVLAPGDAACFRAGDAVGHRMANRTGQPVSYLVVGTRAARDVVHYPETGETLHRNGRMRELRDADGTLIRAYER